MGKKKIIAACVLLMVCLLLNALLSDRVDRTKAYAGTEPNSQGAPSLTALEGLDLIGSDTGNRYDLMKQFAYAVLLVVLLGSGAWYLSRKLVPRLTTARGRNIAVIETVPLGPNKMLHLVEVASGRRLLVGSTSQSVNFLADVTSADYHEEPQRQEQVG